MQRARDRVVAACHLIRSSAACYSDAAKKPAAFGTGSEISFTRCSPHVVVNSLVSSSSASQAYIDRFRGAPSHEVPRIIPRRHPRDKNPVTFGSALMESLLQSSAMLHCADAVTTKPEPVVFNVLKTVRVLQEKNVATERSIALHAAFIERMVQTNQPQMFECVQYHYATLVRYPQSLHVFCKHPMYFYAHVYVVLSLRSRARPESISTALSVLCSSRHILYTIPRHMSASELVNSLQQYTIGP